MLFNNTIQRVNKIYHEYPNQFWVIVGANFVDRVGGALIFPFFALYITSNDCTFLLAHIIYTHP